MSFDLALTKAIAKSGKSLSLLEKAVLQLLIHYSPCYPSMKRLAHECGVCRASIINALENIEKMGLITPERHRNRNNLYLIHKDKIKALNVAPDKPKGGLSVRPGSLSVRPGVVYGVDQGGLSVRHESNNKEPIKRTNKREIQKSSFTLPEKQSEQERSDTDFLRNKPSMMGDLVQTIIKPIDDEEDQVF